DVVDHVVQAVSTLAVGVVGDDVEHRELAKACLVAFEQREVVLFRVVVHEALDRACPEGAILTHDGDGHDAPPEGTRRLVRRDLPLAQRAVREVPERTLAPPWLVPRLHGATFKTAL